MRKNDAKRVEEADGKSLDPSSHDVTRRVSGVNCHDKGILRPEHRP